MRRSNTTEGPWRDVEHVEPQTLHYIHLFNNDRPHEALDDLTPTITEDLHYTAKHRLQPNR